jgi:chemotaxis protein methyltransferase CheR
MRLRWAGFRKVRGQVCKRIGRRVRSLGLADSSEYRRYLETHPDEWTALDSLCRITISRFYRDRRVFDLLREAILPSLAREALSSGRESVLCWSAGCCSGEEPYTLKIVWEECAARTLPNRPELQITATDTDAQLLERAIKGIYRPSSLKDLPPELRERSFEHREDSYRINDRLTTGIEFAVQDIRDQLPKGAFDLIFCRNLVFTYFDDALQRDLSDRITARLSANGHLIIGSHERLPEERSDLIVHERSRCIYRKRARAEAAESPDGYEAEANGSGG